MPDRKTPGIRFKGFTDDWEQRKLGELSQRVIVGLATSVTPYYREEGIPILRNLNIKENWLDDSDILYLDEDYARSQTGKQIHTGDVLTVHTGYIGTSCVVPEKYNNCLTFTTLVTTTDSSKLKGDFLAQYLNSESGMSAVQMVTTQGGRQNLNTNDFVKVEIPYPSVLEQEKICEVLGNLDRLITLHQREYEKLQIIKKSMLENCFPRNEERVPRIRFSGFTGDWEQRKLQDLVGITYGGGTPATTNEEFWEGDIPWIQSSNAVEGELFDIDVKKHISKDGLTHSAAQLIPENSVAVVTHVGVGKLVFMPYSYTTSQDFISLSELKCDPKFLCYALYKKLQEDLHIVQGSAIKGITKEDLMSKQLFLPTIDEQRKIANTLLILDRLITLHQRKLQKLQVIKKSMLEQMFV